MKKKILTVCLATTMTVASAFGAFAAAAPSATYVNDFEGGLGTGVSVVGSGAIVTDADTNFGDVYHNNIALNTTPRSNYLLLPSNSLMGLSGKTEGSISFWVNLGTHESGFMWANMFGAYAAAPSPNNGFPFFVLETRLIAQLNHAGWSDFTNAQNDAGTNKIDTTWFDDGAWHLYTASFTTTSLKIYVDGILQNGWTVNGTSDGQVMAGIFTNTAELDYITLGGNQAWDWGDKDSSLMFDDFAVYDVALSPADITSIMNEKALGNAPILKEEPSTEAPTTAEEPTTAAATVTTAATTTAAGAATSTTAAASAAVTTTKASNTADNTASTAVLLLVAGVGATFVVLASRKSKVTE